MDLPKHAKLTKSSSLSNLISTNERESSSFWIKESVTGSKKFVFIENSVPVTSTENFSLITGEHAIAAIKGTFIEFLLLIIIVINLLEKS